MVKISGNVTMVKKEINLGLRSAVKGGGRKTRKAKLPAMPAITASAPATMKPRDIELPEGNGRTSTSSSVPL